MIVMAGFDRLNVSWVRRLSLGVAWIGLFVAPHSVWAQRIVDNGPRFATDTSSAWSATGSAWSATGSAWSATGRSTSGGSGAWVGGGWNGGGWNGGGWNGGGWNGVPYTVRLAGQNPTFPLAVYGSPRQYGAHDHGFRHVRHPDQARFNQFGRNHWVATPLLPCWQPCPPVCLQPWSPWCGVPPICNPWLAPPGWGWNNPWGWNNGWCGWNGGGWNGGGWNGGGWGWQGWRRQAWGWDGLGFAGGMAQQEVQLLARPGAGVMAPFELTVAPTDVANALIESRAADVLAQQRAVAAAEQAAAQQRGGRTQEQATVERDPLGRPRAALPVVQASGTGTGVVSSSVEPAANTPPRSARQVAESLEQRRAAQAEAERQRLLERLRGGDPKTGGQ